MLRLPAALGVTVKSGWASTVLVGGPLKAPRVIESRRLELSDPAIPESRQPYHEGFGTARASGASLSALLASVKRFGRRSVRELIQASRTGRELRGIGVVVGSLVDPDTIGNDHIRIHALEGQLFRSLVVDAAARSRLSTSIWRERDLPAIAASRLHRPEPELRTWVTALGRDVAGPWRAEQKAAALAACLVLAARGSTRRS